MLLYIDSSVKGLMCARFVSYMVDSLKYIPRVSYFIQLELTQNFIFKNISFAYKIDVLFCLIVIDV